MNVDDWYDQVKLAFISKTKKNSKSQKRNHGTVVSRIGPHPDYDKPFAEVYSSEAYKEYHNMDEAVNKILDSMTIVAAKCPRCNNLTLVRKMRQTRSADEGESCISECINESCGYKEFQR